MTLTTSNLYAGASCPLTNNCVSDCRDIIQKSKDAIAARDKEIADQGQTITDLNTSVSAATADLAKSNAALDSWYHNPVILILLGAAVGGAGTLILEHR